MIFSRCWNSLSHGQFCVVCPPSVWLVCLSAFPTVHALPSSTLTDFFFRIDPNISKLSELLISHCLSPRKYHKFSSSDLSSSPEFQILSWLSDTFYLCFSVACKFGLRCCSVQLTLVSDIALLTMWDSKRETVQFSAPFVLFMHSLGQTPLHNSRSKHGHLPKWGSHLSSCLLLGD